MSTSEYTHPEALVNATWIAELYENGWGVAQDYGKALEWFHKAADAGNTDAMINLGRLYEHGLGVAQDYGKALEWFRKAADAGNTDAMINLVRCMSGARISLAQDQGIGGATEQSMERVP